MEQQTFSKFVNKRELDIALVASRNKIGPKIHEYHRFEMKNGTYVYRIIMDKLSNCTTLTKEEVIRQVKNLLHRLHDMAILHLHIRR